MLIAMILIVLNTVKIKYNYDRINLAYSRSRSVTRCWIEGLKPEQISGVSPVLFYVWIRCCSPVINQYKIIRLCLPDLS